MGTHYIHVTPVNHILLQENAAKQPSHVALPQKRRKKTFITHWSHCVHDADVRTHVDDEASVMWNTSPPIHHISHPSCAGHAACHNATIVPATNLAHIVHLTPLLLMTPRLCFNAGSITKPPHTHTQL